ncbi:MAG: hypothetical protein WD995_12940 [Gemmatimonadota bacterium]
MLASCGPRRLAVVSPVSDPTGEAEALEASTRLEEPLQIIFEWQANDGGVRASGRGVARVEPPYKARLDLFLGNGETALRAALVDGEIRLPPGAPDDILPPPDLLWGALGILRPAEGARLLGGDRLEDGSVRLRYQYADGTQLHYQVSEGVLTRVDQVENGRIVQEVTLSFSQAGRYPTHATYRHRADFRELRLTRETLEAVPPFDEEIWNPIG